jgi:alanine-synthesizing transaminase
VGNQEMVGALTRIKSYLDYGVFQPIQIAATVALKGDQSCVDEIVSIYKSRRDILIEGLDRIGWKTDKPKGTMFVWGHIPEPFRWMGSVGFSKYLIEEAKVAVSPGLGFGQYGDEFVRFALVENEMRTRQAIRGLRKALQKKVPPQKRAVAG